MEYMKDKLEYERVIESSLFSLTLLPMNCGDVNPFPCHTEGWLLRKDDTISLSLSPPFIT
jgi:hypothetical protein